MADVEIQISEIKRAILDMVASQEAQDRRVERIADQIDRLSASHVDHDRRIERLLTLQEGQERRYADLDRRIEQLMASHHEADKRLTRTEELSNRNAEQIEAMTSHGQELDLRIERLTVANEDVRHRTYANTDGIERLSVELHEFREDVSAQLARIDTTIKVSAGIVAFVITAALTVIGIFIA